MVPTGKEAQRAELHKTIWRIANDLRGSVDGWDFKTYVLGTLFYRFISENLAAYLNAQERAAGNDGFDFAELPDSEAEFGREETVAEKGFFIYPSELFANVRERAPRDVNLNETLERVFKNIEGSAVGAESEDDIKGLFADFDVNSHKLGPTVASRNAKLVKLLDAVGDMPLGNFVDNDIDLFGDAYEYLMAMYASQAGKSGGEYYTPQEVSELLARLTVVGKTSVNKVYDPFLGTGTFVSRLLQLGLISPQQLEHKYRHEIFANEIVLLSYYIASINIEEVYRQIRTKAGLGSDYVEFPGITLTDTFQLSEDERKIEGQDDFQANMERVKRQREAPIRVIVMNPPYSAKQASANDNY